MFRYMVLLSAGAVCFADSAVMFEFPDGRTAAMTSSGDVSMVAESVSIVPSEGMFQYFDHSGWLPMMQVRCVFQLVNVSSEEQYISVGFPLDAKFGDSYTVFPDSMLVTVLDSAWAEEDGLPWWQGNTGTGIDASERIPDDLDFRTFVNGTEVPVYYRTCARSLEEQLIWQPIVAVWKMRFEPGETVVLENTYNTSWDYYGGGPWGAFTVNYILTTGDTWHGPIGDAVITLTLPEDLPEPCLSDTLAVYWDWTGCPVIEGREVTWHYTDLNPEENLRFTVNTEQRVNFWENRIVTGDLYDAVAWNEEELLYSTFNCLSNYLIWNSRFDSILMLRILEAVPFIMNGQRPPNGLPVEQFEIPELDREIELSDEQITALGVVESARSSMELNLDLAEQAGYLEFLPLFANRYAWDVDDMDMYAGMPGKEVKFLDLLGCLGQARRGEPLEVSEIRSFYELTGWYHPGHGSQLPPVPSQFASGL